MARKDDRPMFERIMDAIGFVFVRTGSCIVCDAKSMCGKVRKMCHDNCVSVGFYHNVGYDGCFKFKRVAV